MPAGLGFIVQAILGMMGSQSLLHVGALSVRLSEGFLVLMAVCSVRSSCVLYLVVVSMVVHITCNQLYVLVKTKMAYSLIKIIVCHVTVW